MARKLWIALGVLGVAALFGVTAWSLRGDYVQAQALAAAAAKETCSCVHVSGRALDACIADLPADAAAQAEITQDAAGVSARLWLGAVKARAAYEADYGCRLTR